MNIRDEIIEALEELEDMLQGEDGETQKMILPSGAELPCVPGSEEVGTEIIIGTRAEIIQYTVKVRKSHFVSADNTIISADSEVILADNSTGRPVPGTTGFTNTGFRGKTYRVLTVKEDPSGAYFTIQLGSAR